MSGRRFEPPRAGITASRRSLGKAPADAGLLGEGPAGKGLVDKDLFLPELQDILPVNLADKAEDLPAGQRGYFPGRDWHRTPLSPFLLFPAGEAPVIRVNDLRVNDE